MESALLACFAGHCFKFLVCFDTLGKCSATQLHPQPAAGHLSAWLNPHNCTDGHLTLQLCHFPWWETGLACMPRWFTLAACEWLCRRFVSASPSSRAGNDPEETRGRRGKWTGKMQITTSSSNAYTKGVRSGSCWIILRHYSHSDAPMKIFRMHKRVSTFKTKIKYSLCKSSPDPCQIPGSFWIS
jgi:hypothetical protein